MDSHQMTFITMKGFVIRRATGIGHWGRHKTS